MPRTARKPTKRRTYHHGDLASVLVAEASRVVEESGHEAVSVREIARAAGVSAAAPFRHFRDRDELLRAVALEAATKLESLCTEALADAGDDPLLQFRAVGLANVRFAIRHPNLLRLLQIPSVREPPRDATSEQCAVFERLESRPRALVEAAQREGSIRAGDPAIYELAGAALVAGLSQLFLEGRLPKKGAEELAEAVIDVLGYGLGEGSVGR